MSRLRKGMTADEYTAAEQLESDLRQAGELIAALLEGRANARQQRRAAQFLHQWMPPGMQGPPPARASQAIVERIEAAIAKHGSPAAAYAAVAAEDGKEAASVEREYNRAKVAEAQFREESREMFFGQ